MSCTCFHLWFLYQKKLRLRDVKFAVKFQVQKTLKSKITDLPVK